MSPKLKAALVGAIVAIVVGFAASQGLISQQTAEEIKAKTNEVLSEEPAPAPTQTPQPQTNEPQPQAQQQ
ncbi:hypothetical protein [Brucella haematophila]|jgi:hypothetical protein|uniref:Uncharacterized protein n=1 Tax=Brucella haematophila TaxID=419474 RepID=A0ABX1DSA2_9HYPH|nr:hypothetical protein [Brucella haematophila]NKC04488.1 hypothetical protein [Brucella haematophila]TMV04169.1 hypothetical protein FGI60_07750 [Brucella haematophila]